MTIGDRRTGIPATVTSIPLVDPHAPKPDPSIGDLVKDATAQVSTLVRAEVAPSEVIVSVQDTGMGIPQDRLIAIFDEFEQGGTFPQDGLGRGGQRWFSARYQFLCAGH